MEKVDYDTWTREEKSKALQFTQKWKENGELWGYLDGFSELLEYLSSPKHAHDFIEAMDLKNFKFRKNETYVEAATSIVTEMRAHLMN